MISSFRGLRRAVLGLAALLAASLALAAPAAAEPRLWAIRDADSTVYLFGTVHVLKPGLAWRSAKIDQALARSDELVLEILQPTDAAAMQPLMLKHGLDRTTPLSAKLDPKALARLHAAAAGLGIAPQGLEPMRPWLAAMTLSLAPILKAGYDPKSGVELILADQAKAAGQPVAALETVEQQMRFFGDMSPAAELALLSATLDDVDEGAAKIDALVAAWAAGDEKGLEDSFVAEMRRDYPDLYQRLIVGRNIDWAEQLKAKLAGSGVSFVAVGTGHLVGPDSVQAQLAQRGIKVERVD